MLLPGQTEELPVISFTFGTPFTVIDLVAVLVVQPLVIVYRIVAVPPLTPLTLPVAVTVAMFTSLLLQVPPVVASVYLTVVPAQIVPVPLIAATGGGGRNDRVATLDVIGPPQPPVTMTL